MDLLKKVITSLPIILIFLYFIPIVGILLILLKFFTASRRRVNITLGLILLFAIIILIPKIIGILGISYTTVPKFNEFITSELYNTQIINYSKLLIGTAIIYYIISLIFYHIGNNAISALKNYINRIEKRDAEISQKNDLEIKLKQEKAKNTTVVHCPYCGNNNILTEKTGRCKFCRRELINENYKD